MQKICCVIAVFSENVCILGHAERVPIGLILELEGCCIPLYLVEINTCCGQMLYILAFLIYMFVLKCKIHN